MTQEEIIQNNRLIFDFMGCIHSKDETIDLWEMSGLQYHNDFNLLIPVVKKCKQKLDEINSFYIDTIDSWTEDIKKERDSMLLTRERIFWFCGHFNIDTLYSVVLDSIQFIHHHSKEHGK